MKCVTKKFRGLDMQNNDKEYKKCAAHAKFVFFAIVCLFVFFFAVLIAIAV